MGLLPVPQMTEVSERLMASVSTEDTVDAPSGIPWAHLSSAAAGTSCPHLTCLCEGFLQPVAPQKLALPKHVHLRRGRSGGELSSLEVALRWWG